MKQCEARDGVWQCTRSADAAHTEHETVHNLYNVVDDRTGMLMTAYGRTRVLHRWSDQETS